MKTKTLIIIVSVQAVILLILLGIIVYPYLPQNNRDIALGPNVIHLTFDELYSEKIEKYDGVIKDVGPAPDEATAKQKAFKLMSEIFDDVTLLESSLSVIYYDEQECWAVSVLDNSGRTEKNKEDGMVYVYLARDYHALITKSGKVLAVY